MPISDRLLVPTLGVALSTSAAVAQVAWDVHGIPEPRIQAAMAFDVARGRAVLFGGLPETWEYDGQAWSSGAAGPANRTLPGLAYDASRGATILFGGDTQSTANDTWLWDGTTWSSPTTANAPAARRSNVMAYDEQRARIVLFGGAGVSAYLADTWEWDGTNWLQRTPASSPPGRMESGMCYDSARGVCVLFGGYNGSLGRFDDTWEWDGVSWTQRAAATRPLPRTGHAMAFDVARGRTVLFGGLSSTGGLRNDTWEWNGTVWSQRTTGPLAPRYGAAMCFDRVRNRTLLFGGGTFLSSTTALGDAWEWDGTTWQEAGPPHPSDRTQHAMAHDATRGETVLFGGEGVAGGSLRGLDDTWTRSNGAWVRRSPASHPSIRGFHAVAYDPLRDRTVLFGGGEYYAVNQNGPIQRFVDDTWQWDGVNWSASTPAVHPAARMGHAMAFDPVTAGVLLFGGVTLNGSSVLDLDDTWSWDGATWTNLVPANRPPARNRHGMATVTSRARVAVFGGTPGLWPFAPRGDLWEWDGADWHLAAAVGPPPRCDAAVAYDAARERLVVAGGRVGSSLLADTWEWDGQTWAQRFPVGGQPQFQHGALVYEPATGASLLFDGRATGSYACLHPAHAEAFGAGCPGSQGLADLGVPAALPWLGDPATLTVTNVPTSAAVLMLLGWSRSVAGPLALPLALDPWGMPGCSLLVAPDMTVALANTGGAAVLSWAVPASTAFLDFEVFAQAAAADPGANALGVIATSGVALRIGSR